MQRCPRWRQPRYLGGFQIKSQTVRLPEFLVPFTAKYQYLSCRKLSTKAQARPGCLETSANTRDIDNIPQRLSQESVSNQRAFANAHSRHPEKTLDSGHAWATVLDRFLPRQLQESPIEGFQNRDVKVLCHKIVSVLSQARIQHGVDVLQYLGIKQRRWRAVIWIVKTLSEGLYHLREEEKNVVAFGSIFEGSKPLEKRTRGLHKARPQLPSRSSKLSVEAYASNRFDINGRIISLHTPTHMNPLSQILQSLGSLILAAAEQPSEEAKVSLSYVRQIFAYLHHIDVFPDTIYDWHPNQDPTTLQRPPTLHLLSSRILTSLSDAMWRAREEYVANEARATGVDFVHEGHEVPGARYRLRVRDLGPEVWMELLLWSCVDTGYVEEGAWILSEVKKRKGPHKWSVISWLAVQDPLHRVTPSEAAVDWDRAKHRFGGPVGKIEGYSFDPPFVQLGERTVSAEVVAALINGLVNNVWVGVGIRGQSVRAVLDYIINFKEMLERDRYGLGVNSWNQTILRLIESQGIDVESDPGIMETVLELAPTYKHEMETVNTPSEVSEGINSVYALDRSSIAIGLLQRSLSVYVNAGNLTGALRVFSRMQAYTDKNKRKAIKEFAGELADRTSRGIDDSDLYPNEENLHEPDMVGFAPWIHPVVLAKLLDLITQAEAYKLGSWLIYAKDVDGPIIRESSYDQLAPALLRFASATDDHLLLGRVGGIIKKRPYSLSIDIALLQCQVKMGNWRAVQNQFRRLQAEPGISWKSEHAVVVCSAVLQLHEAVSHTSQESLRTALSRAQETLAAISKLEYGFPTVPLSIRSSPAVSLSPPEYRTLQVTWFTHIFDVIASASPILSSARPVKISSSRPKSPPVHLPIGTMTTLLSAVVIYRSPKAGKDFFSLWFERPPSRHTNREVGGGGIKAVPKSRSPVQKIEDEIADEDDDGDLQLKFDSDLGNVDPFQPDGDPQDIGGLGRVKATVQCVNIVVKEAILRSEERKAQAGNEEKILNISNSAVFEIEDQEVFAWATDLYRSFGVNKDDLPMGFQEWAQNRIL